MRKKIIAGNWKMNHDLSEAEAFFVRLKQQVIPEKVEVVIAPSFVVLPRAFELFREHPVQLAAQNMHQSVSGAFTGEVSAKMLKSIGIEMVIIGHSERRSLFNESHQVLAEKVDTALNSEMNIIFCVGEELEDRRNKNHFDTVQKQLSDSLFHLKSEEWKRIIIAYEPVWAIGTGETATPEQAQEMHEFIRRIITEKYSNEVGKKVSILYGGSVNPGNAKELFSRPDVDGGLVGGASLEVDSFMEIAHSFKEN